MTAGPADSSGPTEPAVHARRRDRLRFLNALYQAAEADVGAFLDGVEIADALGIAVPEAERFVRYFEDRGYVRQAGGGGLTVRITADGVDHVESRPTES